MDRRKRPIFSALMLAAVLGAGASAAGAQEVAACPTGTAAVPESADGAACRLAAELEKAFVYPEQGEAYAAALRANVASGRYAALSPEDAARIMTADLQAVAKDGHLRVELIGSRREPGGATGAEHPPAIEHDGWIAPGIAFVRINAFLPDDAQTAAVAKFMEDHAEAEAIVFDIRTHGGGGLAQMDAIFPWLFGEETRLVTMAMRRSVEEEHGTPFGDGPTLRKLAGTPRETVREHWALPNGDARLRDAKVYLLTSERTGSAAEHFALAMKHTGRATLVGSNTAGANHFGGGVPLPGGFGAFVPVGRTYDPLTGKDWEGNGVAPDVVVAPADALVRVLVDLGIEAGEARRLSDGVAPTQSMERWKG